MNGRPVLSLDLLALARAHVEAENKRDIELTMDTISDAGAEYVVYANGQSFSSREDIRDFYEQTYAAFPDMHVEIQNLTQDIEHRQVMLRYVFTATFTRTYMGLPPTNRRFSYDGAILYEFDRRGKLTKELDYFDLASLLTSMGIIRNSDSKLGQALLIFPQNPIYFLRCIWYSLFGKNRR